MTRRCLPSRRMSRRGSVALEFALSLSLLWLLLYNGFRFGYSIYAYESLLNAVAGAARYAARTDYDATFATRVSNMAVYGTPAGGGSPLAPQLDPRNVSVVPTPATGVPLTITVSIINYPLKPGFQSLSWSGKPSVTVRYAGSYKS